MKTLNWGDLETRKIVNTELLNKTNIAGFVDADDVALLNRVVELYETENITKRVPDQKDKFYLIADSNENGNVYLNIDVPLDFYIWGEKFTDHAKFHLEYNKAGNFNSVINISKLMPVKIVSTANSVRINVNSATLLVRKHEDNTFSYVRFGSGSRMLKVKKNPDMKKVKAKTAKGVFIEDEQPNQEG